MNMQLNTTALQTIRLSWTDKKLIGFAGISPALVEQFGNSTDIAALRTRGVAELALFVYAGSVISIAAETVFGTPGSINPLLIIGGYSIAYLMTRMDAYLHVRGLYHSGKLEVRKAGAQIGDPSEDFAYYGAVAARFLIGVAQAVVVGTMAGQALFAPEINASFNYQDQQKNASIIALHTQAEDDRLKAAREAMKRAADGYASIKKNEQAVRAQDVANLRSAARQSPRQLAKSGIETMRTMTSDALKTYESKGDTAETRAQVAAKAYDDLLAGHNDAIRTAVVSDPRYVPVPRGVLARLGAIRSIAKADGWAAAGILLIDAIGCGMELWLFVLFLGQIPTHLAVALYCEHKKRTSGAARDLVEWLGQPLGGSVPKPHEESEDDATPEGLTLDNFIKNPAPAVPARRPRGRPRKNPIDPIKEEPGDDPV